MKLEVGKYYRTRDGRKAGPVYETSNCNFPFGACVDDGDRQGYTAKGCWLFREEKHHLDLIAEWTDEPDAQPAGPVRTITRKEIVPGDYGPVAVTAHGIVWVRQISNAATIRAAIAALTEIADAMEENSK